ncbi:hypothetical protein CDL12_06274 [Handroanthus impetiginosus]|uniref:Uncharacterized protein n=1 Tax=Handroanthus impetiginosus TaxID=429701 RepID=A0A2G9HU97_9LAMI|nr:hypothetical protein CDL12_06274 [Handroanthus impetiginosus]
MESRRRQNWDNHRRSLNRRPPRASWQPTVPAWEKEFCRVVGSLDWETVLQMKKFTHLYENVIKWNDSAGKDAFFDAKKRFWAEINGLPCDVSLPDPDLYVDKVDWDSQIDPELLSDLEIQHTVDAEENHDPVVIFGDSLLPKQEYSSAGWGDDEENFKVPANYSSANHHDTWEQNWSNNGAAIGWPGYSNNGWHVGDGSGYMTWGGGWGWNYTNDKVYYEVGPHVARVNDHRYTTSRVQVNDRYRNSASRKDDGRPRATYWGHQSSIDNRRNSREWNSFNSYAPISHHAAIAVGQTWNQ